jgi:hypothetical protein
MEDDDYYEEAPPMPTFSGGSYGKRGDLNKAASSRTVASKQAIASALRSATAMASSLQSLSKTSIKITNAKPIINNAQKIEAIMAARKREEDSMILARQTPTVISKPLNTVPLVKTIDIPPPILATPEELEEYNQMVKDARENKKELVKDTPNIPAKTRVVLPIINLYKPEAYNEITTTDSEKLSELCINLSEILKNPTENTKVLDAFLNYQLELVIQKDKQSHAFSVSRAANYKSKYLSLLI